MQESITNTNKIYSYKGKALKVCAVGALYKNDNPLFFRAAINSVINQTNCEFDIHLVIDGPLGDKLEKILYEYKDQIFIHKVSSRGLGLALKAIFENNIYGQYDIAIRFDSDDINSSNRFEKTLHALIEDDLHLVSSYMYEINELSEITGARKVPLKHKSISLWRSLLNPFNHPASAFRVDSLKQVGGYSHCLFHEDWLLWLKFINAGFKVGNLSEYLVHFRVTSSTIDRRFGAEYRKHERNFYRKAVSEGLLNPFVAFFCLLLRQGAKLLGRSFFTKAYKQMRKLR